MKPSLSYHQYAKENKHVCLKISFHKEIMTSNATKGKTLGPFMFAPPPTCRFRPQNETDLAPYLKQV